MNNVILCLELFFVLFFILASAFFSLAETSFTSITKMKIKGMVKGHGSKALRLEKVTEKWDHLLITMLICNNVCNISATSIFTVCSSRFLQLYHLNMEQSAVISTVFMAFVILIFGEIIPKTFAKRYAEKIALNIVGFLDRLSKWLFPIAEFFKIISVRIMKIMGVSFENTGNLLTEKEIVAIVEAGQRDGAIEEKEGEMIRSVIEFGDTHVREVMMPRVDMVSIDAEKTLKEALDLFQSDCSFSRIPVVMNSVDNITGILYVKDLMKYVTDPYFEKIRVLDIARKASFIPDSMPLDDALHKFKRGRIHMGIVIDEYGGTAGLVTIEDLLEEIVGDIMDEHDGEEVLIRRINNRVSLVDAKTNLYELNEKLNIQLPEDMNCESLGGFLISIAEGMPEKGCCLRYKNIDFQILEADEKRIYKVKVDIKEVSGEEKEPYLKKEQ